MNWDLRLYDRYWIKCTAVVVVLLLVAAGECENTGETGAENYRRHDTEISFEGK